MSKEILTVTDLMERYSISRPSVYNYLRTGRLPKGFYIGKSHRWTVKELEAFENEMNTAGRK